MSKSLIVEGESLICPECQGVMTLYKGYNQDEDDANPALWDNWVCELDNKMIAINKTNTEMYSRVFDINNKLHGTWNNYRDAPQWTDISEGSKCPICDNDFPKLKQHMKTKHKWFG